MPARAKKSKKQKRKERQQLLESGDPFDFLGEKFRDLAEQLPPEQRNQMPAQYDIWKQDND